VPGIAFDQVVKRFGEVTAVRELTLDVADGEFVVLVGPSGCGKTTALRMLAGLEAVSSGRILIGDREVQQLPPRQRDVAMVFQDYALYPQMSVYRNLAFGLQTRKVPREQVRRLVTEAAERLGLSELLDRKPRQLSGGQRQRVALGRALVRDPKVFLLDEPLSNLDAKLRLSMRVEIARLHRQLKATMIYVTHDQIEAMTLGQRIVVLDGGVIQQVDTPMALYEQPANLFVAGFVGSPAMNLIRGTLRRQGGWRLAGAQGELALGEALPDPAWSAWCDREVVLGIRPEHLQPVETGAAALIAQLEVIEPVGNEIFLNLRYGDLALVSRVAPRALPEPGSVVPLGLVSGRLHLFDGASGTRIGS